MQDHRLETENKLKHVNDEIRSSLTEIEHAITDYITISYKLNECQIELATCVEEYKQFHSAIEEVSNENLLDWYMFKGAIIGFSVSAAVGGVAGSTLGPLGTIAGLGLGVTYGGAVGISLGALAGYIYEGRSREQNDRCKK